MSDELKQEYADKSRSYFEHLRPEMLARFPAGARRALDVGCGAGVFGAELKKKTGCEVWGVEPDGQAFAQAVTQLDRAVHGFFGADLGLPEQFFDCIYFNDVLEHMVEPAVALALASKLLAKNGRVIASVPNLRHFPTLWRLVMRGEWNYAECGILDHTHLRFFTRSSLEEFFRANGFKILQLDGFNAFTYTRADDHPLWKYYRIISRLPNRHFFDMRFMQFAVVAEVAT